MEIKPVQSIIGLDQKVIQIDAALRVVYANTAMANELGIPKSHITGSLLADVDKFSWGPGFLAILVEQCRTLQHTVIRDRNAFDPKRQRELSIRITVSPTDNGFQILMEDRTEYLDLERRFSRYVSPKVIETMKAEGRDFGIPRRHELSVLFADLRGFTRMSEELEPEAVRETLNAFLSAMMAVAEENDAMVDKIIGDGIMVLCGAPLPRPDHALQAVKIGLEMQEAHEKLKIVLRGQGRSLPGLGIGINSGVAVVGDIGSDKRSDFTVIGHMVNLASRICDAAGEGEIVVSSATRSEMAKTDPEVEARVKIVPYAGAGTWGSEAPADLYRVKARHDATGVITIRPVQESAPKPRGLEKRIFGKYQVLEEAARGGMGIVYKAVHSEMGRVVALKILKGADFAGEAELKMFHREIEIMSKLCHPNIVPIHDVGTVEGQRYFTMDFLEGCTLGEFMDNQPGASDPEAGTSVREILETIRRKKSLARESSSGAPPATGMKRVGIFRALNHSHALNIILKIIRAVEHAHDRGLIHRDIKPANIMMTRDGEPVLMDFGLARELSAKAGAAITQTGQVVGTPAYMSPEQAEGRGQEVCERTDIYSLGCVLYEMLSGRPPFIPTGNPIEDLRNVSEKEPATLRTLNPRVARDLETICQKAMEKDAARRYRTAGAFAEDIQRYINGDPIQARPQSLLYRLRKKAVKHRTVVLSSAISLTVLAAALFYWFRSDLKMVAMRQELSEEKAKAEARWILAYENDFNGGALDSANWVNFRPELNNLAITIDHGALKLEGRGRLMSTRPLPGNIRVVFDAKVEEMNEVTVMLNNDSTFGTMGLGYRFLWNEDIMIWRKEGTFGTPSARLNPFNDRYFSRERQTVDLRKHFGEWFQVALCVEEGVCMAVIAGRDTLACEDVFSLTSNPGNGWWGFRSIVGRLWIDNLKVYSQVLPAHVSVTRIADILAAQGAFGQAKEQLRSVIRDYNDPELLNQALRKIMALGEMSRDSSVYFDLLKDPSARKKITDRADPFVMKQLLRCAISTPGRGPDRLEVLNAAISEYAARMDPEARFQYWVYMGLAFNNGKTALFARRYWQEALLVRKDTIVQRYLAEGTAPRQPARRGTMKFVPAGYLPDKFGEIRFVRSFWMDSTEVTQSMFRTLMGYNPSYFNGKQGDRDFGADAARPVEEVRLFDAMIYCNQRSKAEGLDTVYALWNFRDTVYEAKSDSIVLMNGVAVNDWSVRTLRVRTCDFSRDKAGNGYRLPTPREFEYAQRAETVTDYLWGDDASAAGLHAWFSDNSGDCTHPVAGLTPNHFGLYDLAGNVGEWTFDGVPDGEKYYLYFGGTFSTTSIYLLSGHYTAESSWNADQGIGFRCVR